MHGTTPFGPVREQEPLCRLGRDGDSAGARRFLRDGESRRASAGVRDRLLWLSSRDANRAMQAVFAVVLMALALALTLSRSGMLSLAAALVVCGWAGVRRHRGGIDAAARRRVRDARPVRRG